ncbi:hypothetical protein A0J61_05333 [Choanephora cucurbitarum]|uniref:DUF202 domain-containing protein n=1 Tax=Choanephora cucurbitarum TaxID=101091 RepID=A0A1C7NBW5_9FUNG|nr:hypothetical protein A0J61_05333 [Choanephora cucurbitarum]
MDVELNAPEQFTLCNNEKCSTKFKYLDYSIHTVVDGPDPRDHLANERNLLTWIRTGTTLALIDYRIHDTIGFTRKEFCSFL